MFEHKKENIREICEQLFGENLNTCDFEHDFVLYLELTDTIDLQSLITVKNDLNHADPNLHRLSKISPVIIFDNASLSSENTFELSDNIVNGHLGSDFFHRDIVTPLKNDAALSFISNPLGLERLAPTYVARSRSVENSASHLTKSFNNTSEKINAGLSALSAYEYSISAEDRKRGHMINATLGNNFTMDVFDNIQEKDKFSVEWPDGKIRTVMLANNAEIYHARPASDDAQNNNIGLDAE